jgi:acetyltransferase-like isoleucine patch superfamily enzyme
MAREASDYRSHGDGSFERESFGALGDNVIFEAGVMVFHPENIRLGRNVYVGHQTILKGYHTNTLSIGDNTWIGQQCFIHSAGGISIGRNVGIGPGVKIMSSSHEEEGIDIPIMSGNLVLSQVSIGDNCDLGLGCIVLPGVTIGVGCQIGAGAVVTKDLPDYSIAAGVPARVIRSRKESRR